MGEMPRLSNTDPWQIAQAFQHEYGRQGLTPYQRANLALKQQKLAGQSGGDDQSSQDASDDAAADAADGSGDPNDMSNPANRPPILTQPMPPAQLKPLISQAASDAGVDLPMFTRLVKQESQFNPNAKSPAGAKGLTQLMPDTARGLGVTDPYDPQQNLEGGARYLAQQAHFATQGNGRDLAAYNWGPGNVQKWIAKGADPSKAPKETQDYVKKITGKQLASSDEAQDAAQDANPDEIDPTTRLSWLA